MTDEAGESDFRELRDIHIFFALSVCNFSICTGARGLSTSSQLFYYCVLGKCSAGSIPVHAIRDETANSG